jgi:hypothetical protein
MPTSSAWSPPLRLKQLATNGCLETAEGWTPLGQLFQANSKAAV